MTKPQKYSIFSHLNIPFRLRPNNEEQLTSQQIGFWSLPAESLARHLFPEDDINDPHFQNIIDAAAEYPDAEAAVDHAWWESLGAERQGKITQYLSGHKSPSTYRGLSPCRLCTQQTNGDHDDGTFAWPGGYVHYVRDHHVRPPDEFLAHVMARSR